jgi:hypothetical protein
MSFSDVGGYAQQPQMPNTESIPCSSAEAASVPETHTSAAILSCSTVPYTDEDLPMIATTW